MLRPTRGRRHASHGQNAARLTRKPRGIACWASFGTGPRDCVRAGPNVRLPERRPGQSQELPRGSSHGPGSPAAPYERVGVWESLRLSRAAVVNTAPWHGQQRRHPPLHRSTQKCWPRQRPRRKVCSKDEIVGLTQLVSTAPCGDTYTKESVLAAKNQDR